MQVCKTQLEATSLSTLSSPDPIFDELPWYSWWVRHQVRNQPHRLFLSLPGTNDEEVDWDGHFMPLWSRIRELLLDHEPKSVDKITSTLIELGILSIKNDYEASQTAKELVFFLIGWQTMLYQPELPARPSTDFTIFGEMNGHLGDARLCLRQPNSSSGKDLASFLLGFGVMLPPRDYNGFQDPDDQKLHSRMRTVTTKEVNAHVLAKVCRLKFQWVDSLSCHLELDTQTGTLYLYRYPSFCIAALQSRSSRMHRGSPIHGCALGNVSSGSIPWADEDDITQLLQEILLSYRLLFGQDRKSRRMFKKLRPFARIPREGQDERLTTLCREKRLKCPVTLIEREEYDLLGDFPHLRTRLVRLNSYAAGKKPRSFLQLWKDKRDSTAWLALWSVLVFGSLSIMLGLIQTVFQIMQYVLELQQGGD